MNQAIEEFVKSKRLAVVGVSRTTKKFGNSAYTELKNRGYQVFGVNSNLREIGDEKCYKDLTSLRGQIDGAVVCVSPEKVGPVLREAAAIGLRNIWLQQGAESAESSEARKRSRTKPGCGEMYFDVCRTGEGISQLSQILCQA